MATIVLDAALKKSNPGFPQSHFFESEVDSSLCQEISIVSGNFGESASKTDNASAAASEISNSSSETTETDQLRINLPASQLDLVENVLITNASMSVLAIVSKHCGSNELLYGLLKGEKAILNSDKNKCKPTLGFSKHYLSESPLFSIKIEVHDEHGDFITLGFHNFSAVVINKYFNTIVICDNSSQKKERFINSAGRGKRYIFFRLIVNTVGAQVLEPNNQVSACGSTMANMGVQSAFRKAYSPMEHKNTRTKDFSKWSLIKITICRSTKRLPGESSKIRETSRSGSKRQLTCWEKVTVLELYSNSHWRMPLTICTK